MSVPFGCPSVKAVKIETKKNKFQMYVRGKQVRLSCYQ